MQYLARTPSAEFCRDNGPRSANCGLRAYVDEIPPSRCKLECIGLLPAGFLLDIHGILPRNSCFASRWRAFLRSPSPISYLRMHSAGLSEGRGQVFVYSAIERRRILWASVGMEGIAQMA